MKGRIIKAIAGFYYVAAEPGVYSCKAKGIFRQLKIKPLVGDFVEMEVTHEGDMEGNITKILPRANSLVRPAAANIDQALVIFACDKPQPNLVLLDRFLVTMEHRKIPSLVCFNKTDTVPSERAAALREMYEQACYPVCCVSAASGDGLKELEDALYGKLSVVAGPSGVGKSTLINLICPDAQMETGELSAKIERGRHTTRHSELMRIDENTYIMDTPGFTCLYLDPDLEENEVGDCFPEFRPYLDQCRFAQCSHIAEKECGVKDALSEGKIGAERYAHYADIYKEVKESRKY